MDKEPAFPDIREFGFFVLPARAGIQIATLDSRLRGNGGLPENQGFTEHYPGFSILNSKHQKDSCREP
jgi:hypothetical protein